MFQFKYNSYLVDVESRLRLGNNLIITEETQSSPLGTDEIEEMIRQWFGKSFT